MDTAKLSLDYKGLDTSEAYSAKGRAILQQGLEIYGREVRSLHLRDLSEGNWY